MTNQQAVNNKEEVVNTPDTASGKNSVRRGRVRRRCLRNLLLVVVATTALNAAVASLLITWRAPAVVSFDMKGTLDQFTGQAGTQELSESQAQQLTERFMTTLDASLRAYQSRHDALILVTPAVVTGSPDITVEIQQDVAQRMASGG